jgi:SAM-dependent methyltransferase
MARKWRQIDKFLEVLDHAIDALPPALLAAAAGERPLRVVDYGCGKGYLTFAVHEHLRRRFGVAPQVTGSSCALSSSISATASPRARAATA